MHHSGNVKEFKAFTVNWLLTLFASYHQQALCAREIDSVEFSGREVFALNY